MNAEQGLLIAPTASGKTEMGLAIISAVKQPALWLTHTIDLIDQAKERAVLKLNLSNEQWGIYGGGEKNVGSHITFATVQTLARLSDDDLSAFGKQFGIVVVDECHRAAAGVEQMAMFERALAHIPAKYRIGLTASDHRSDGLMATVYMIIGPKFMEIEREVIKENLITPRIVFVKTEYEFTRSNFTDRFPFSTMIKNIGEDTARNLLILQYLAQNKGQYCLILGDSLTHLEYLQKAFEEYAPKDTAFMHSGTSKQDRKKILENIKYGHIHFLFATYALAKEGLDIPRLNRLFLVTPKRDKTLIQQSIGRVSRRDAGKTDAIVYDFWDENVPICTTHARARIKDVYEVQKCEIYGGPKRRANKQSVIETLMTAFD